jgi:hypothetical protein
VNNKGLIGGILVLLGIVALLSPIFIYNHYLHDSERVEIITVSRAWIKAPPGSDSQDYLFSDTEGNVLSVQDEFWYGCWNASDRWVRLEPGKTYRMRIVGWRIHFWSMYPNVLSLYEIES